jgi:gamma-glutamyltranspeptidase/glutathione hydrolase
LKILSNVRIVLFTLLIVHLPGLSSPVSYGVETDIFYPVRAKHGMVASADAIASQVGVDILRQGGNAVDAAVAVGFALAVTHPQAGNIGGGGFMLLRTQDGNVVAIDFREMAPAAAHRNMFLNEHGEADAKLSLASHLASGVPGSVAGLTLALQKYGTLPLNDVMQPAIRLADDGFIVSGNLAHYLATYGKEVMSAHPTSRSIFFRPDGNTWQYGERLYQKDLANSLKLIARDGPSAFYSGAIAKQIVGQMSQNGGLITLEDMKSYRVIERQAVSGSYKGYQIYSMPPPSSGGIHIIQIMNILENFDLKSKGQNSAAAIHLMAQAMKYAYADRSEYLGDPDFVNVPVAELTSKAYSSRLAAQIDENVDRPSSSIKPGLAIPYESAQTTHYSVVDSYGNVVAVTYTLNTNFGSGIVAGNTGILLNNQMDDFSVKRERQTYTASSAVKLTQYSRVNARCRLCRQRL